MSNKTLTKEIGYAVKKAMQKYHVDAKYVAEKCYVSTGTVYSILEGKPVAFETMLLVLTFLNIKLEVKTL